MEPKSSTKPMKVCCFGAGYVGTITCSVMAKYNPEVEFQLFDINQELIDRWTNLSYPLYEPGLRDMLERLIGKNIFFTTDLQKAISNSSLIFLCVNTPSQLDKETGIITPNMSYVNSAMKMILDHFVANPCDSDVTLVVKSTVPLHTTTHLKNLVEKASIKNRIVVTSNPEFLAEGIAIHNLEKPDRIVIGSRSGEGTKSLVDIYLKWIPAERIIHVSESTSEVIKLASNAMLAQRVSSINSLSLVCEKFGGSILELAKCVGLDNRIGAKYLMPSIGFGGSCLRKDIQALVYLCKSAGLEVVGNYWQTVIDLNDYQRRRSADMVVEYLAKYTGYSVKAAPIKVCLFGLAFKKDTNDTRDSSAM